MSHYLRALTPCSSVHWKVSTLTSAVHTRRWVHSLQLLRSFQCLGSIIHVFTHLFNKRQWHLSRHTHTHSHQHTASVWQNVCYILHTQFVSVVTPICRTSFTKESTSVYFLSIMFLHFGHFCPPYNCSILHLSWRACFPPLSISLSLSFSPASPSSLYEASSLSASG